MKNFEKQIKKHMKVMKKLYQWDIKEHKKEIAKYSKRKKASRFEVRWKAENKLKILNKELKQIEKNLRDLKK